MHDELRDLLALFQLYGVTDYKGPCGTDVVTLTLTPVLNDLPEEGEFELVVHETQLTEEPTN